MESSAPSPGRQARRKAATRRAIMEAADRLFTERGYVETTMEDIAEAADVGVRTIYLHFDGKSGILLAHFDDWLDAFVDALRARPVDEPVPDAIAAALARMVADGWTDRSYGEMTRPHPTVQFIGDGALEIAGHIMHSWVRAQERLAADVAERGGHSPDALEPWSRAAEIFAAWTATILYARDGYARGELPAGESGNTIGARIARQVADGSASRR
ncbi:TetR/AcrR family transcriptional regulator [Protaetiibacter intestinalis]|uniref:TetR/AcrR family transcriptional regulator n=1 Tax=Protaetiibacter intestinalis TaxID=2419774 RepID=A0A387B513_9MICO|nr:TetR/AcrR family transcriptional regulator [Protaetiibacter intestinalis]AYF97397.1 TetR/AcrR family transcriptional regulator [Protaetiibacter intestinalis]